MSVYKNAIEQYKEAIRQRGKDLQEVMHVKKENYVLLRKVLKGKRTELSNIKEKLDILICGICFRYSLHK